MEEQRRCIQTPNAPAPIGPYCQGNIAGPFVFVSAVGGARPDGSLAEGGIGPETEQALANVEAILRAGGCSRADVAKVTVYLARPEDRDGMNAAYRAFFRSPLPARSLVQMALPWGLVAFDAVALRP